jgi:ubiquinone biosynthesis protein UbiJ
VTYSKTFNSIIDELETEETEIVATFTRFLEFSINFIQSTQELREEILDFDNIYQFYVNDINFELWIEISNGSIIYKKGININSDLRIFLTKNLLLRLIKQDITITDAYMKGLLKMQGDISQVVKFRNLVRFYSKYVKKTLNFYE